MKYPRIVLFFCVVLPAFAGADDSPTDDLPPYVLRWPDSINTILVADAQSSTLTRYSRDANSRSVEAVYLSVGQRGVGKQREGDRRTPLGAYFVTEQLDTTDLDPMYGVTAFPLDYPNARDRSQNRDGGGIWLHGVLPGGGLRPARDTDGCLAIPNDSLEKLAFRVEPQITPVIITRALPVDRNSGGEKGAANTIERHLRRWLSYRQSGNTYALAALYDESFKRQGLTKAQWVPFWAAEPPVGAPELSELFIAADPEEDGLFISRFRLRLNGVETYARLYWRRQTDTRFVIVAEDDW